MSEQFKSSENQLPLLQLDQLIQLSAFLKLNQASSNIILNLHDHSTNLKYLSDKYIQRQKQANKKVRMEEEDIEKQQPIVMKKSRAKVQMISIPSKNVTSKLKSEKEEQIKKQNTSSSKNGYLTEMELVTDKKCFSKTSSRKKVESVPEKKVELVQEKKEFQPQRLAIFAPKQYLTPILDTYMGDTSLKKTQKPKQPIQKNPQLSQINKYSMNEQLHQQKISQKLDQTSRQQQLSVNEVKHCVSDIVQVKKKSQSINQQKPRYNKSYIIQKRQNFDMSERSRSKSITKAKIPKQSNMFGKVKLVDQIYQQQSLIKQVVKQIQPVFAPEPKTNRVQGNKKTKQSSFPTKMKNIKIDDRNPIQLMPDEEEQQVSYIQEYKQHFKNEEPDIEASQDDIANIKPLTVAVTKKIPAKQSIKQDPDIAMKTEKQKDVNNQNDQDLPMIMGQLKSSLIGNNKGKQLEKINIPYKSNKIEEKPIQSSRKKIFQPISPPLDNDQKIISEIDEKISLDNLTELETKMMLGVRGNKYKQAMMIQLIKQNRRTNKK